MKYLLPFIISLLLSIALRFTNLDLFLIGWFSCMGWYVTIDQTGEIKTKLDEN